MERHFLPYEHVFSTLCFHVQTIELSTQDILKVDRNPLLEFNHEHLGLIYSPAHALVFATNPFCYCMRQHIVDLYGNKFNQLGQGILMQQCREVLRRIASDDDEACNVLLIVVCPFHVHPHGGIISNSSAPVEANIALGAS